MTFLVDLLEEVRVDLEMLYLLEEWRPSLLEDARKRRTTWLFKLKCVRLDDVKW